LNICAILSQLKRHKEARKYAASAVSDLMTELRIIRMKAIKDPNTRARMLQLQNITPERLAAADIDSKPLLHQTLSMAYYNLAVEYEYCKEYD